MRTQSTKNRTSLPVTWVVQAIADIPESPVASGASPLGPGKGRSVCVPPHGTSAPWGRDCAGTCGSQVLLLE